MSNRIPPHKGWHIILRITAGIFGGIVLILIVALLITGHLVNSYVDPWQAKISDAGYEKKATQINQVNLSYVEGPDNGPPLVLLHAQHMDWFSYSRVLIRLSELFHVYDVDYPGHGETMCPDEYAMTANQIGYDLGYFLKTVVGEPVFVTGNSSGGLLTAWLAANEPELVRAILLEDPPLFSAEYPRIKTTIAYRSFTTSYNYVQDGANDFLLYWIESNSAFFNKHIFKGAACLLEQTVKSYRRANPEAPVEIRLLANDTIRLFVRGLDEYDARFGAAFYDGSWNNGFDHGETLKKITCPTMLLHANFEILENGILNGAMGQEDADKAMSLLPDGTYVKINASHVVHLDKPDEFVELLKGFFLSGGR